MGILRVQAKGLAHAKGQFVGGKTEEKDADELRLAVADALCRGPERLKTFKEVLPSIESIEGGLRRYFLPRPPLYTTPAVTWCAQHKQHPCSAALHSLPGKVAGWYTGIPAALVTGA